jgi:soluble lytic murein transglycosylase
MARTRVLIFGAAVVGLTVLGGPGAAQDGAGVGDEVDIPAPTFHPPIPNPSDVWIAPSPAPPPDGAAQLARAATLVREDKPTEAGRLLRGSLPEPLASYQRFYRGLVDMHDDHLDTAAAAFEALAADAPARSLAERARLRAAEIAETRKDYTAAVKLYEPLTRVHPANPADVWLRLGLARLEAGDRRGGLEALAQVYFEFPTSDLAPVAAAKIKEENGWEPLESGSARYRLELGRAERLFGSRRYAQARDGFELVQPHATGDDAERVALRLAECDFYMKRYRSAREALEPYTRRAARKAEARYFYLAATRALGSHATYVDLARQLVADFPEQSWAEEALNSLGTHYILVDEDDKAEQAFLELLRRFPDGKHGARASWKAGWAAYRAERYADAAGIFDRASATFSRSDYRPAWLYWGARAYDKAGDRAAARRLFGTVAADYLNSYYGRLTSSILAARKVEPIALAATARASDGHAAPASLDGPRASIAPVVQALLAAGLYDDAIDEIEWARRTHGDSPVLDATLGLVWSRKGDLRRGINAVKRGYPQYLSAQGELLPIELREVLFPTAYWDLIQKYSRAHDLDPYLIAALMAQESTFDADIRSPANAYGLMQIVPPTGRRYARKLGIRRFRTWSLTNPEINVRIGTKYFADLLEQFGAVHLALAAYNAGPTPVRRWVAERSGLDLDRDEFIDDIPYPETQLYVKKILGTAEDYRHLYGELGVAPVTGPPGSAARAATTARSSAPTAKKRAS